MYPKFIKKRTNKLDLYQKEIRQFIDANDVCKIM